MLSTLSKGVTKVFGSRNDRLVKSYTKRVESINPLESEMRHLTDDQLREKTVEFQNRCAGGTPIQSLLPEIMAAGREIMDRAVGIRKIFNPELNFDPQQLPEAKRRIYDQVKAEIDQLQDEPVMGGHPAPPWMQVEIPLALYEAVRELYPKSKPPFRARPFDVQLIGGMVLGEGRIAEMKTGEGKTIVAPLACYVACIEGLQCHVITVNDYLVQRDRDWVFPFYYWAGLTVGAIHPMHMQPPQLKAEAYQCNVVYGTNSEFGFDYLRDNMKLSAREQVQKKRDFCIVDEIDSILIDEARTPLIISGPAHSDTPRYELADKVAAHLMQVQRDWNAANEKVEAHIKRLKGLEGDIRNARDKTRIPVMKQDMERLQNELLQLEADRDQFVQYYEVELEKKAAHLTHEGVAEAQKVAGIGSFYVGNNMDFPHLLENALRSHVVYKRDKDYVVQGGEVIIVDENTGRLMIGRQWSDGLHQAVEAKERVEIKQETQTLATVTIQNFFKLYKRLAGMTGTAITESTEFMEIYRLEVVCIPTNVPVIRKDRNDLVFLSEKDKWNAILDEIKNIHDVGRPVLVGTTSVERSEMLSQLLLKRHGIKHEVLNAKQHEREAEIVAHAGKLGAVMIATNMAGRGTDIRLAPIDRGELIKHWQLRNLLSRQATAEMNDEDILAMAYRHQARVNCGLKERELEQMSDADVRLKLFRHWVVTHAYYPENKVASMSEADCVKILDEVPEFIKHRLSVYRHVEELGGLHIVGTERHESRRIDNQLRGRAGRQGDRGSSRFFISLEDDLMKMFAGPTTLKALSRLGMKEGDAIEHSWITKSVERAQRKVEERNFQRRKVLLEYDEVMEHQRSAFYGMRQDVLDHEGVSHIIFEYISDSVGKAVETYLAKGHKQEQMAEWCRQTLDVSIDPARLPTDDLDDLISRVRKDAGGDIHQTVEVTIGEYMPADLPQDQWDYSGLSHWAMSRFSVDLKINRLRTMEVEDVKTLLIQSANEQLEKKDLSGLSKFIDPTWGEQELSNWIKQMFNIEISVQELVDINPGRFSERVEQVTKFIVNKAEEGYRRREVVYPVDFMLELVSKMAQHDGRQAAAELCHWARQRYGIEWTPEQVSEMNMQQMRDALIAEGEKWLHEGKLEQFVDDFLKENRGDADELAKNASQVFHQHIEADELADSDAARQVLIEKGRSMLRNELTQLERFVLLQILDQAWKDHLYAMDQLKDSVNLQSYAEKDPRIVFKREGSIQFEQMQENMRQRVTELAFRARLTPNVQVRNVYQQQEARHEEAESVIGASGSRNAAAVAAQQGSEDQRADHEAAERAGGGDGDSHLSRKQRRAKAARGGGGASKSSRFKKRN